ncbi:mucin-2-like [Eriocheir sinensis]|uniref:mucin-2-like n=1 Tax=Eriocheir sinensis TaxID=95602 RepID=UPI0021C809F4|nr:mucin-2-like [Eriocheir sinensis]
MAPLRRVKLTQLNAHLVCVLCSGYFVDATTIIECLHTFCKTCIVRYLQTSSFCPICDVQVHKTKPLLSLREDRTLQDVVFKLVPGLFNSEMKRRTCFYKEHPEGGGDKTEQSLRERRHFFHVDDQISLSLEHATAPPCPSLVHSHLVKPLKVSNGQQEKQEKQKSPVQEEKGGDSVAVKEEETEGRDGPDSKVPLKRYLRCPAAVQVSHLEKFVRLKYNLSPQTHRVEIMHGGDCLVGELTLLDVVYMYKWTEDAPLRLMYSVTVLPRTRKRARPGGARAAAKTEPGAPPCKVPKLQPPSPESKATPPHVSKCQDVVKGGVAASSECKDEKSDEKDLVLPPQTPVTSAAEKPCVATSAAPVSASLSTQTVPSTSVTQTSIMSCGSVPVQLPVPGSARARPALTTTTPATATPRVALPHMPPQAPPATVPVSSVAPNAAAVAPAFSPKTPISPAMTSTSSVMIQTPQPLMNGLSDCGMKQIRGSSGPTMYANKMPQPIIPTRPRLGRPPNSSRIQAAKMRPPAPRMPMNNVDVRHRPMGKKVYPAGVVTRPNSVVCASLNVQNRLSSISGPPAKLAASKVSVKRSGDVHQDGASSPLQHPPVSTFTSPVTTTTPMSPTYTTSTQGPPSTQPPSSSLTSTTNAPPAVSSATPTTKAAASPHQGTVAIDTQTQKQCLPQPQGTGGVQRPSQQSPRPPINPSMRPTVPQGPRYPGPQGCQRQPLPQGTQRVSTPPGPPRPPTPTSQKPGPPVHQQTQGTQQHSSPHLMQPPSPQGSPQPPPMGYPRTVSPAGHGAQKHPLSANQRLPNMSAQLPHLAPGSQRPHTPVNTRPPSSSAPHRLPSNPAPYRSPSGPAPHRPPSSPAPHRPPSSPAPHRPPSSPAPHRSQSSSPAPHRPPNSSPAPHRPPTNNSAPQRPPSSPAPHRPPSSPASHSSPGSPAPHRQPGSMTPRPHSTPTPPSNAVTPSPRSTPSPRCASSPSTTGPVPVSVRDALPPLSITSPATGTTTTTSTAPPAGTTTTNGNASGPRANDTSNSGKTVPTSGAAVSQTPNAKTVSPGSGKTAPKSPGRGRGTSSSPTILSIAQSLANKQLQQRTATTAMNPVNSTAINSSTIGTTQINAHHSYTTATTNTPVYPSPVPSSLVPLAAYMATYGDATPDVTAMRNLITLSQTAACIRELNMAMVKTLPRPSDPAPIDLSPTSKAAPQTPLTNGRHPTTSSSSSSTAVTKTTNSKSPTKTCRPSATPSTPNISPPTPEVTITKLPNTGAATSTTTPTSGTTKNTFSSGKLGSSNTNTVSITKRPASSKIAVTKSPANASVRQIPNPSFVRHQSEARNNNNVSKSTSSSASNTTSTTTNTSKSVSNKHGGGGGRAPGNSPLKETGPLPETSSILKIENLTKSLTAPAAAAAAAASHGFAFFDNR